MTIYYQDATLTLLLAKGETAPIDQLCTLPDGSVDCVVTSPPYYGLRDYAGHPDQIGLEETPAEYVARLNGVFAEVHRALAEDGTLWLNLGDSYSAGGQGGNRGGNLGGGPHLDRVPAPTRVLGFRPKNLLGIPWRVAFALQDAGWYLRNAIVWNKTNAMPESVQDRLSTRYELLFLLTRSPRYWFDLDPIRRPHAPSSIYHEDLARRRPHTMGKGIPGHYKTTDGSGFGAGQRDLNAKGANPGDVWEIATTPLTEAHFAAFPPELPRQCILAGCKPGGTVLDPFSGAGTTAMVAQHLGHPAIGIDLVAEYHDIALRRMSDAPLPFGEESA